MSRFRSFLQTVLFPVVMGIRHRLQYGEERQFYDLMHKITIILNGSLELEEVIAQVLNSAHRMVAYHTADVRIIEGDMLYVVGTQGFNDQFTVPPVEVPVPWRDFPLMREVYETGRAVMVHDTRTDSRWKASPSLDWIRAHLKVPIKLEGRVIGFLNLDSGRPEFFTPKHARWMQVFADQAAVAIRNAQLYTAEHEQRLLNEALKETATLLSRTLVLSEVFDNILHIVGKVVPHETSNIMLVEGGHTHTIGVRGYDKYGVTDFVKALSFEIESTEDFRLVVADKIVSVMQDTHTDPHWKAFPELTWVRSHLKAPILIDGEVIGFLHLDSAEPYFFTEKHKQVIRAFAEQAALAIKNARLYTAEHEHRLLNEALNETAALLNSTLVLDEIFDNTLNIVGKVIPHETSNIMLVEGAYTRTIGVRGYEKYGLTEAVRQYRFKIGDSPHFYRVMQSRQVVVVPNVKDDPEWLDLPQYRWIHSHLKAPILIDGEVIGILCLDSSTPNFFTEKHITIMRVFADQMAVAVKNARLYAELDRERARLEAILDATREGILYLEDGLIQYANRAFIQMTGDSDVYGHSFMDFLQLPEEERSSLQAQMNRDLHDDGQFHRRDLLLKRRHEEVYYIDVTVALVNEKNPQSAVIMVRDMNQEKRLQMRQSRFITHAAHELRHPLANFMTRLYLLRRKPQEMEEQLTRLDETTQRMTEIIEDMLIVSRFGQGQVSSNPIPISMQEAIGQAVLEQQALMDDLQVKIQVSLPDNPLDAVLDRTLFVEMVSTLLVNAITYGGENSQVGLRLWQENNEAVLQVTDSGQPLPQEQQAQFFEPFHRPSAGRVVRTGLELTIAEYIVMQHKGTISIQSDSAGNTITVRLPLG
ncbi:MAG: GAF domain-containing protein [Anaerolineae bacterium]|nr:GAF domain-containing protein [Anaerolineae bacterium]